MRVVAQVTGSSVDLSALKADVRVGVRARVSCAYVMRMCRMWRAHMAWGCARYDILDTT